MTDTYDDLWLEEQAPEVRDSIEDDVLDALLEEQFEQPDEDVERDAHGIPEAIWARFLARAEPQSHEPDSGGEDEGTRWGVSHSPASTSAAEYCEKSARLRYFKQLAVAVGFSNENAIPFANEGGLLNKGVCWWHSRLQRNAFYLTTYRPHEPRPSKREAKRIIAKIRRGRAVVEIPGFANFRDFCKIEEHESFIQRILERWQLTDGLLLFSWVNGLAGQHEVSPERMRAIMDELYVEVEQRHRIAYVKLAIPGPDAHAWLIVQMQPQRDDGDAPERITGYKTMVIDSNSGWGNGLFEYRDGMTGFLIPAKDKKTGKTYYGSTVPYLQREKDFGRYAKAIARYRAQHVDGD